MMKLALALLLATLFAASVAHGEGVHSHKCACEAEEFGFDIDCDDTIAMLDALTFLKSSNCATDCSSAECERNWLIVQVHHDYCPEGGVPEVVEDGFHDYDMTCMHCDIVRPPVVGAPDCPMPSCADSSGNDAYVILVEGGCMTDCSSDTCREYFFVLRAAHDGCDEGAITTAAELGLHDLEVSCAMHICNAPAGMDDPLVCDEEHGTRRCCSSAADFFSYIYVSLSSNTSKTYLHPFHTDEPAAASGVAKASSTTGIMAALLAGAFISV